MNTKKLALADREEVQHVVEEIVRVVLNHVPEPHLRIYLFGSWAVGGALSTSDIDLAIDLKRPLQPSALQRILEEVDELPTLRKVDLLDLQTVNSEFRKRVQEQGKVVHGA